MGAHTALRLALDRPVRVAALGLITPAFDPSAQADLASWDALAAGLREGGVEGFLAAYDFGAVSEPMRATLTTVIRQRLGAHEHPAAVADALESVPRSRPFEAMEELAELRVPVLVLGSRDEADPGHPLAIAERYAASIPGAQLILEDQGRSPIAWQGGQLSRILADLSSRAST
jgi:pimeloyl-ACP methyl ester carboxylesterase